LALKEKYPKILKNLGGNARETCMSWVHDGISVNDGWLPLLDKLMHCLQFHHDKNGYPQVVADQIKEKFGTLRFYYHTEENDTNHPYKGETRSSDYLSGIISFAESMSSMICENCGDHGEITRNGWIKVRCKNCTDNKEKE